MMVSSDGTFTEKFAQPPLFGMLKKYPGVSNVELRRDCCEGVDLGFLVGVGVSIVLFRRFLRMSAGVGGIMLKRRF